MAESKDKDLEPGKAAKQAAEKADAKDSEEKFSQERLVQDAFALTGYTSHEVAGALHDVTKKELSVTETKAAVAKWLKAEVKVD